MWPESFQGAEKRGLSPRELEVMHALLAEKRLKEIANELGLSVKTVSTHRARILEKLKMTTTADLMGYALRNNLVW